MPRGDGTGPAGLGPMTGRAAGYCAGNAAPGFVNRGGGFGGGRGRGGGRGWRNCFYATGLPGWQRAAMGWPAWGAAPGPSVAPFGPAPTKEQELAALRNQAESLQGAVDAVRQRIEELGTGAED